MKWNYECIGNTKVNIREIKIRLKVASKQFFHDIQTFDLMYRLPISIILSKINLFDWINARNSENYLEFPFKWTKHCRMLPRRSSALSEHRTALPRNIDLCNKLLSINHGSCYGAHHSSNSRIENLVFISFIRNSICPWQFKDRVHPKRSQTRQARNVNNAIESSKAHKSWEVVKFLRFRFMCLGDMNSYLTTRLIPLSNCFKYFAFLRICLEAEK